MNYCLFPGSTLSRWGRLARNLILSLALPGMSVLGTALAQDLPSKASLSAVERKMDMRLVAQARSAARSRGVVEPVFVVIQARITPELLSALRAQGATGIKPVPRFDSVSAIVPPAALSAIAARSDVRSVGSRPELTTNRHQPTPAEQKARMARFEQALRLKVGGVTWEGVTAHKAHMAHAGGFKGAGVKVCVLSDGIQSLASRVAAGTLPAVDVLPGQSGPATGDEGTAMLEIVHDMAPDAALGFATAYDTPADFAQNILDLRAAHCDVIVDDITYFNEPAFQDGPIAQAVNEVVADGALYFSSAANSNNLTHGQSGTFEGDFVPSSDPPPAAVITYMGSTDVQALAFPSGKNYTTLTEATYYVSLKWSDPQGQSGNDYDVVVTNSSGSSLLGVSASPQSGLQDPYEFAERSNGSAFPSGARVYVIKYSGNARAIRLDTHRGVISATDGTAGSAFGHNAAGSAISVGSVDLSLAAGVPFTGGTANPVQVYSSDGPRRMFYKPDGTAITPGNVLFASNGGSTLPKVDMAAGDCGQTTVSPDFLVFCGTSAAAPTAAAIAALIKSANPTADKAAVLAAMRASALDIEAPGDDRDAGMGLVMVPSPLTAVLSGVALPAAAGSVACTPVNLGGNGSCTATANTGWRFKDFAAGCTRTSGADASTCEIDTLMADATVTARFEPYFSGSTQIGTGMGGTGKATFTGGGAHCGFDTGATGFEAAPSNLPAGLALPQGMFRFKLVHCDAGSTVSVRVTWPQPVTGYTQWGFASAQDLASGQRSFFTPSWQVDPLDPNTAILTVTDGALGDDDWAQNGEIVDPSGPALRTAVPPETLLPPAPVPVLAPWALMLLSVALAGLAAAGTRRFRAN